jgi:hypothetical protein
MKLNDIKLALVHQEVDMKMQIAELAAQLIQLTVPGGVVTTKDFFELYNELCNEILESLIEAKDDVVSQMQSKEV